MAQPINDLGTIQQRYTLPWPLRIMMAGACLVIIIAGLKAVAPILNGFLSAMLLALVLTPVARKLIRWRVPKPLAILITMLGVFIVAAFVIYLVSARCRSSRATCRNTTSAIWRSGTRSSASCRATA